MRLPYRGIAAVLAFCYCSAAESPNPGAILKQVADRYRQLTAYQIEAVSEISMVRAGQVGTMENKTLLAAGPDGQFRVEQISNGIEELRLSDGKTTWKALPKQKVWSKGEVAEAAGGDEDDDSSRSSFLGLDLFTQTQHSFVARYTGLGRYADSAVEDGTTQIKYHGAKAECYVLRISLPGSTNRIFIQKDTLLVLRHQEQQKTKDGTDFRVTTDYKRIEPGLPGAALFTFQPASGYREIDDVLLPSEKNMSLVGQKAADFTLPSLDGSSVHLAGLRGKIVLLDFWATWCAPCRHELPSIEAISRKYKDRDVLVFGINSEEIAIAKRFLEKNHPDLATLHDPKRKVSNMYGAYSIPAVLVINPEGTIVAHFVGTREEPELVAALKRAGLR